MQHVYHFNFPCIPDRRTVSRVCQLRAKGACAEGFMPGHDNSQSGGKQTTL